MFLSTSCMYAATSSVVIAAVVWTTPAAGQEVDDRLPGGDRHRRVERARTAVVPAWSRRIFSAAGTPAGNAKSCLDRSASAIWREPAVVDARRRTRRASAPSMTRGSAKNGPFSEPMRPWRATVPGPSALLAELMMPYPTPDDEQEGEPDRGDPPRVAVHLYTTAAADSIIGSSSGRGPHTELDARARRAPWFPSGSLPESDHDAAVPASVTVRWSQTGDFRTVIWLRCATQAAWLPSIEPAGRRGMSGSFKVRDVASRMALQRPTWRLVSSRSTCPRAESPFGSPWLVDATM